MIEPRQIRAALELIEWTPADLAASCELDVQTIRRICRGTHRAQEDNQRRIVQTLESKGVEFIEPSGVRFKPESVDVLSGKLGLKKFFDQVFVFAQQSKDPIRQNGLEERLFAQCDPTFAAFHSKRMATLAEDTQVVTTYTILRNGDFDFSYSTYAEYRWHPENLPPPVPYYVFGDSIGIFSFQADPPPKIVLITSPVISASYRRQFDETWAICKTPPQRKQHIG